MILTAPSSSAHLDALPVAPAQSAIAGHHHEGGSRTLLRQLLYTERKDLWAVLLYSIVIGLIYLAVPIATQAIVNTVAFGTVIQPLIVLTIIVFVALSFAGVLQLARTWVVELLQQRFFVHVSGTVASKLLRSDLGVLKAHRGPELVNRFLEVATLQKATSVLLIDGLATASQVVFSAALLALYHPWLLGFDALLILLISLCIFPFVRGGIRTSIAESATKYDLVAWLEELARYPDLFRSESSSQYALNRTGSLIRLYLDRRRRHFRILLRHITGFVAIHALSSAALLGIGGWLVIQRQLTLGQLIASELVVNLMLNALTKFGKQLETYYDLEAAMDKLGHLTNLPGEQEGSRKATSDLNGITLALRDVSVFDADRNCRFEDLNLVLAGGTSLAMRDPAGAARDLLLDCIRGSRPVDSGAIEVDGYDLRHLSLEELRSQVALVRQIEVFDGTILENLTFGKTSVSDREIRNVLVKTDLWDVISRLPGGLETHFLSGAAPLTHQQALRLMMARALLSKPRLLIIDIPHATSSLRNTLLHLLEQRDEYTLLLCTDDPELVGRCDRAVTLFAQTCTEDEVIA